VGRKAEQAHQFVPEAGESRDRWIFDDGPMKHRLAGDDDDLTAASSHGGVDMLPRLTPADTHHVHHRRRLRTLATRWQISGMQTEFS